GDKALLALTDSCSLRAMCTAATCRLMVGFISSLDGGQDWSGPEVLAGPIQLSQIAPTSQGVMVGDYISTSFLAGQQRVVAAFAVGLPSPTGAPFDEPMFTSL